MMEEHITFTLITLCIYHKHQFASRLHNIGHMLPIIMPLREMALAARQQCLNAHYIGNKSVSKEL
eukprot:11898431-Ditylum_brightwellii.AAC.1